jgi:hypothetical protein
MPPAKVRNLCDLTSHPRNNDGADRRGLPASLGQGEAGRIAFAAQPSCLASIRASEPGVEQPTTETTRALRADESLTSNK